MCFVCEKKNLYQRTFKVKNASLGGQFLKRNILIFKNLKPIITGRGKTGIEEIDDNFYVVPRNVGEFVLIFSECGHGQT